MIAEHLPILLVAVPLLAAPLSALAGHPRAAWGIAVSTCALVLAGAIGLLAQVSSGGAISYALGGWAPPIGIEYRVDILSAGVALIVAIAAAIVTPYALRSVEREVERSRIGLFYAAFLLCLAGLLGIVVSGDVFNVFVFLEISSLSAYALISMGRDRRALAAAYRYLIMGSTGATFIVIAIGLAYAMTGTLNMADLAQRLPEVQDTGTIRVAYGFLAVGCCLKLALFPLHQWLPAAYAGAPSAVTAFMASTATKVAVYMLLRLLVFLFGPGFFIDSMGLGWPLGILAILAVVNMSAVAIYQNDVKRMLAYSSVAQIGYIVMGISFGTRAGVAASLLHLFNHALMKGALFLAAGAIAYRMGAASLRDFRGVGKTMPVTMAAFVLAGLSLVGVPGTVGFISKFYLVGAALETGMLPGIIFAVVILGASTLALVYIWRVVEAAYLAEPREGAAHKEAPWSLVVPTCALALLNLWFGVAGTDVIQTAQEAARVLIP